MGAVLFALVGLVIDRWLGTTPWLTVVLAVAGFAGATISIAARYRTSMAAHSQTRASR